MKWMIYLNSYFGRSSATRQFTTTYEPITQSTMIYNNNNLQFHNNREFTIQQKLTTIYDLITKQEV